MNKPLESFFIFVLVLTGFSGFAQNSAPAPVVRDPKLPVLESKTSIDIIGTVIAHDDEGGFGFGMVDADAYIDTLIIRIEKVQKGEISWRYVRADFLGGGGNDLPKPLFQGTKWKMMLEPANLRTYLECKHTIAPSPRPDSLEMKGGPRLVPVGGATSFPDPNALYCYVMKRENIQEIRTEKDPQK